MKELGVTSHPNYKICFMLDSLAMISVHTPKYGVIEVITNLRLLVKSEALKKFKTCLKLKGGPSYRVWVGLDAPPNILKFIKFYVVKVLKIYVGPPLGKCNHCSDSPGKNFASIGCHQIGI